MESQDAIDLMQWVHALRKVTDYHRPSFRLRPSLFSVLLCRPLKGFEPARRFREIG